MTSVSIKKEFELNFREYEEFSRKLLQLESFGINSVSSTNIQYFVDAFFDSYTLRKRFLKNRINDFLYINLSDNENSVSDIDQKVLREISRLYGVRLLDINSLKEYLENTNQYLVLLALDQPDEAVRFMLSYNYILDGKFILISDNTNYFKNNMILNFSEAFINFYINNLLQKIGLSIEELKIDLKDLNNDLSLISNKVRSNINLQPYSNESEEIPSESKSYMHLNDTEVIQKKKNGSDSYINEDVEIIVPEQTKKSSKQYNISKVIRNDISNISNLKNTTDSLNLTAREQAIYENLVEEGFISRRRLAEIAWGDEGKDAKPDAIDQVISRLRKKFVKAGYEKDYIFVRKGEGLHINASIH